jgi:two-component system, LytTR family, sensor kinase
MFSHPLRYVFILLLAVYSFINTLFVEAFEAYHITFPVYYVLLLFILISLFVWEGNRFWDDFLQKRNFSSSRSRWVWQFGGSLLIAATATLLPALTMAYFLMDFRWVVLALPLKVVLAFGFRINLFLNTANLIFVSLRQLRQTQLEAEEFKKISIQAQLQSLKNQVNPHFLFNNLNVLSALIVKNPEQAVEFIEQFSKVYRYVLQNQEKEVVELQTELDFINSYFYLLKTRFNGSLNISLEIEDKVKHQYIVPVALQMLIENAVKHNISSKAKPLYVNVFTESGETIVVKNNFQPKEVKEISTNIGLSNISKRYQHLTDKNVEVSQENGSFTVKLPLIKMQSPLTPERGTRPGYN